MQCSRPSTRFVAKISLSEGDGSCKRMIAAAFQLFFCMVVFTVVERLSAAASPHKWWRRPLFIDICGWLVLPLAVSTGISLAVLLADSLKALVPGTGILA